MSMKEKLITTPVLSGGPSYAPSDRANLLEVLQRSRRIETKLTRLLETEGIQTGIQRPWLINDQVMLPSTMTTLDAVLNCIPEGLKETQIALRDGQNIVTLCKLILY